jgi:hypothetical protein
LGSFARNRKEEKIHQRETIMNLGYTGILEVTEQNLATIGRFIHRCGLLESAVNKFIQHYKLEDEVNLYNKKARKSLDDKIEVLKRYCHKLKIDETIDKEEFNRAKSIHKNIWKYKRKNGVKDLRNTIAHNPMLISVMGAWQPGPGYIKPYPDKVRITSGETVDVLTTWNFPEIDALADELLSMLFEMGYIPKEQV